MIKQARLEELCDVCRPPSNSGQTSSSLNPKFSLFPPSVPPKGEEAGEERRRRPYRRVFLSQPSFCRAKLVIRSATCR
jgi:hypothetical protein